MRRFLQLAMLVRPKEQNGEGSTVWTSPGSNKNKHSGHSNKIIVDGQEYTPEEYCNEFYKKVEKDRKGVPEGFAKALLQHL